MICLLHLLIASNPQYHLFEALKEVRLIKDQETCRFSRCGRTDRGVSSFCQVVGLDVRSRLSLEEIESGSNLENEFPYVKALNGRLPSDIRIIAWAPTPKDFNARFDCKYREYKYFFPLNGMHMDKMREGATKLVGVHDFRHFCKKDKTKIDPTYVREIFATSVEPLGAEHGDMCIFTVRGSGFLYHQVRCMMSILFQIGRMDQPPSLIDRMLDIEGLPVKPNYDIASEIPLTLFDVAYEPELKFIPAEDFVAPSLLYRLESLRTKYEMLQFAVNMLPAKEDKVGPYLTPHKSMHGFTTGKELP